MSKEFNYKITLLLAFLFFILFSVIYIIFHNNFVISYEGQTIGSSYILLYLLPFLMCIKNKIFRIIILGVTFVLLLMSFKRGGIVAMSFGVFFYYLALSHTNIFNKKKLFFIIMLAVLTFVIGFEYFENFNEMNNDSLTGRFQDINSSSSRSLIYIKVIDMIMASSPFELIFGHGWNKVIVDDGLGYSSHNDYLEIIYDMGVIGLVLFIIVLFKVFHLLIVLLKRKSNLAPPLALSCSVFLVNSMVSHIWFYPYNFLLFTFFWGVIESRSYSGKGILNYNKK